MTKVRNLGGHFRCTICNKVSLEDIATELGDYTPQAFVHDPKDPTGFICVQCNDAIEETKYDWYLLDNKEDE